jgi:hypothetical protein
MDPAGNRAGLCAACRFHRLVPGARSTFYLCDRSLTDPRFARYPQLPVLQCAGYVPVEPAEFQPEPDPRERQ